MFRNLSDWLDHRTGYRKLRDAMLLEHIPGGAKWRYVWGSTLAFVFGIQLLTGVLLMLHYSPGDTTAWGSVYFIQYEMDFGWLVRGLHHFGSQTMVVLLGVHMLQVVIAGAQLPPREFNWWLGLGLMGIVLGLSLTGYLLPWDQKGYFATRVATNIAGNMPVIGPYMQRVIVGGPEYGNHTLTQFFTLHVGILPPLLIVLLVAHLAVFRRHGVTVSPTNRPGWPMPVPVAALRDIALAGIVGSICYVFQVPISTTLLIAGLFVMFAVSRLFIKPVGEESFWPAQAFRDLVVCLWIFAIMASLVLEGHGHTIDTGTPPEELSSYERWAKAGQRGLGANLDAPADRDTEGYPARPEWYFLFLFQLLKYFEGDLFLVGTLVIPNGAMVLLALLPLFGYGRMRKFGHAIGIVVVVVLILGVGLLTFLALVDDSTKPILGVSAKDRHKAEAFHQSMKKAEIQAAQAVQLAYLGIPQEGGRELLRNDPKTRGPKIFAAKCASCHNFGGYEHASKDDKLLAEYKKKNASDLEGYGSPAWIKGMLADPGSPKYFGLAKAKVKDDKGKEEELHLDGMIRWRAGVERKWKKAVERDKEAGTKKIEEDKAAFELIADFVADQSRPPAKRDKDLEKKALPLFEDHCATCHNVQTKPGDLAEKKQGPDLTRYGSTEWIRHMVMTPSHPVKYGERNLMPAFRPIDGPGAQVPLEEFRELYKKTALIELSDIDREIVIRWITGDQRVVFGGQPIAGSVRNKK